jgi:hypothetical protein
MSQSHSDWAIALGKELDASKVEYKVLFAP